MITLSILLITLCIYSIWEVKKNSGSWHNYDPTNASNIFTFFFTTFGLAAGVTGMLIFVTLLFIIYLP